MKRIYKRLIALLTFTVGVLGVWYLQPPTTLPGSFQVSIPPVPVPLTPEEILSLPNSCGHLVVTLKSDGSLWLNGREELGTFEHPEMLQERLRGIFEQRVVHRAWEGDFVEREDLPDEERILRFVAVKSPRSISYENVVAVIDAVKGAGASPIVLQLDELPE